MALSLPRRSILVAGFATACAPVRNYVSRDRSAVLEPILQQALAFTRSGEAPSISIAVIHRGAPICVQAFGWADRERRRHATPATPYAIASASKPFTATAIAQLIAAGEIAVDAPIARYVSGEATSRLHNSTTTVRKLLQHRSGIPRHWRNHFLGQEMPRSFAEVAGLHAFTTPAEDARYLYSNMNYGRRRGGHGT